MSRLVVSMLVICAGISPAPAAASSCQAFAGIHSLPGSPALRILPVALEESRATFTYISHSTYRIESPAGVRAVTDYAGYYGDGPAPDVATMNFAHSSHWTPSPDPDIGHVLRGWDNKVSGAEGGAEHYLEISDMVIRNVSTDIRSSEDGYAIENGNSIFIFEIGDLCIGHLGHLHHEPTEEQYALVGRLDVVMAPVDGGMTLSLPAMIRVLKRFRASIVLPMHWFGDINLQYFLQGMSDEFAISEFPSASLTVSAADLPSRPTVMVPRRF